MSNSWRELAHSQYGVITRAQALAAGLSASAIHRRLKTGALEVVAPGTYLAGGAPSGWRQRVMAAVLSYPGAVAACRTAGALYGLPACRAREIEIMVTHPVRRAPAGIILRRTNHLPDSDIAIVAGIPATCPARTLLDLGSVMDVHAVRHAVDDALRKELVTPEQLHEQLNRAGKRGRPGTANLRAVLCFYQDQLRIHESPLEEELLRVITGAGLPTPRFQFEVRERGLLIARLDAAYPELRIGIEADGYEWHSARPDWIRDRRRQNALVSRSWTILRFCLEDVDRPAAFLTDLRRVYEIRSRAQSPSDPR